MKARTRLKKTPDKAIRRLNKLQRLPVGVSRVRVGLPAGSNAYPDGTSVILVGFVHEFGSPSNGVPERSYIRSTLSANRRAYKAFFTKVAKTIVRAEKSLGEGLRLIGLKVESDIKETITEISSPPLKIREGNPLVDTGHLRRSITHEVEVA